MLNIDWILDSPVSALDKGFGFLPQPIALRDIARLKRNILRQDFTLPIAVLKKSALCNNSAWMRAYLQRTGALLCPHGKTTMSPQLFQMQLDDGAWGLTCATSAHLAVYRAAGVKRVIFANEFGGAANINAALAHLADPQFDFYCLVDSIDGAQAIAARAHALGLTRPVNVLIEIGAAGARTGVRHDRSVDALAAAIGALPALRLAGVDAYEGVVTASDETSRVSAVIALLDRTIAAAARLGAAATSNAPFILSAGGSELFDLVVERFGNARLPFPTQIILRSGCYLSHDSAGYEAGFQRMLARRPDLRDLGALHPALELWAYVQSRPEPSRAYCTLGKRDVSYDWDLPQPSLWFRPGAHRAPAPIPEGVRTIALNDQHAHLETPPNIDLRHGDLICFGVSHPCTTFDKWRIVPIVDDDYLVTSAVRTFF